MKNKIMTGWNSKVVPNLTRRNFLGVGAAAAVLTVAPSALAATPKPVRELTLVNLHTDERTTAPYWEGGDFESDALVALNSVLRDHRTGDVYDMDARLYDALTHLNQTLGGGHTFHIISGYRSPASNAALRKNSSGVAKKSFHMRGMAVDVRVPTIDLNRLHRAAKSLKMGGVGKYAKSNFIHFDVGPVRYW